MIELLDTVTDEEEIRRGRNVIGALCTLADGRRLYLAQRKHAHLYRGGHSSISEAMAAGHAGWTFSETELMNLRLKKVALLAVTDEDTSDLWMCDFAAATDPTRSRGVMLTGQFNAGTRLRLIPLAQFEHRRGDVELPLDDILSGKHRKKRRARLSQR
jgi:hypothetical protein